MPASHTPSFISLLSTNVHSEPPVSLWIEDSSSEQEIKELLLAIQGIPSTWLRWADKKIKLAESRGYKVRSRGRYAVANIWSGLTLLQECKFLCDALENAFRFAFIKTVSAYQLPYSQLYRPKFLKGLKKHRPWLFSGPDSQLQLRIVFESSFDELIKTMALHWKGIDQGPRHERVKFDGFRTLFWSDARCRDLNLFKKQMSAITKMRNGSAHSRHPFSLDDLHRLKKLVSIWLKPLDVDLMQKVLAYRQKRPNFLQDLDRITTSAPLTIKR